MKKFVSIFFIFMTGFGSGWAEDNLAPRTPRTFFDDGAYLFSSPLRLTKENYKTPLLFGSMIAASALLDRTVRGQLYVYRNTSSSKNLRKLGDFAQESGPVIGTLFAIHGWTTDNDKSIETAYLSYESFLWAGAITGTLKYVIGRERPSSTDNPFSFRPGSGNVSFPSGHTTEAFAAATVFSEQYPHWYVVCPAYAIAASVGFSRTYANQHWSSDVVAGAILGTSVSHILRLRRRHRENYTWTLESGGTDIRLVKRF